MARANAPSVVAVRYSPADNDRRMQHSMVHFGRRILRACSGAVISTFVDAQPGRSIHYAGTGRMAAGQAGGAWTGISGPSTTPTCACATEA